MPRSNRKKPTEIFVCGEIDGRIVEAVREQPDRILLCSDGGDLNIALGACDLLCERPCDVVAIGTCASAAIPILVSGRRRLAYPSTRFLFHPTWTDVAPEKSATSLQKHVDELRHLTRLYCEILASKTKLDLRKVEQLLSEETFLGCAEALEFGIIDEVL